MYAQKMAEFDSRWRTLEAGQAEVKQNLIKFNNFVREKQGKVEGGMERMKVELVQQKKRDVQLNDLHREIKTLMEAKKLLGKSVKKRKIDCEK